MAIIHQPLLVTPQKKTSHCKTIFLLISVAAIICTTSLITINLSKPTSTQHNQDLHHSLLTSLQNFLKESSSHIQDTIDTTNNLNGRINDRKDQAAVKDCLELMDLSVDRLNQSISALENGSQFSDAHAWLSSVLTNHVTCLDGLTGPPRPIMKPMIQTMITKASTSLAMLVSISPKEDHEVLFKPLHGNFPSWVTGRDRKLLEFGSAINAANVVVAKDGSGNFKTVKEAVASAPDNGKTRYTIYIKKGTYVENVEIGKKKTNVMLTGDGMDLTIITGSLNVVDGSTTFNSATVAVVGDGFIAQDICFRNTAGAAKHQAVALRVTGDTAVINRCKIDAYQDTLYTHSNRHFFRDCYVTGTVDFIFGNAAVVFQNSQIVARKPDAGQKNMLTAQGRTDPNQNTGTSIQNCNVVASSDLEPVKKSVKSYLGRPWKEYSRTVFMQSTIGDHIDPAGWAAWDKEFALKTLYYGEYLNKGAGAGTSGRVKWAGFRVITSAAEAKKFTVAELIQGGSWLKSTGVAFTEGL